MCLNCLNKFITSAYFTLICIIGGMGLEATQDTSSNNGTKWSSLLSHNHPIHFHFARYINAITKDWGSCTDGTAARIHAFVLSHFNSFLSHQKKG